MTFTQPSRTESRAQKQARVCAAAGAITVREPEETPVPSVDGQFRTSRLSAKTN